VNEDCLKLTTYFGDRDRVSAADAHGRGDRPRGRFLADALLDVYARHEFATSVLLRGSEGFGVKHHLHTQRLLTLSEDLPLVSVAVDTRERIMTAAPEVAELTRTSGLVTLERARLLADGDTEVESWCERLLDSPRGRQIKLTVYCGRYERARAGDRPAFAAVVDLLHRRGIAGATVLLGVDGTSRGARRRARFLAGNAEVPLMIISVGDGERFASVLPELGELLARPLLTLERVRVCKRDGERVAELEQAPGTDDTGLPVSQKLMVYSAEHAHVSGRPLYLELIHRLRRAGASGATALRGIWGYHGEHPPHGDKLLAIRRHVPVVTVIVDEPAKIRRSFEIVDALTDRSGLVTSELVPVARGVRL
jgi:PII-like signaling protein